MKRSAHHSIEPLEARIAPARLIVAGVPNGGTAGSYDSDYYDETPLNDAHFIDTEELLGDTKISDKVGKGVEGLPDTFFLRMSKGDLLQVFRFGQGEQDFLHVISGNVVAFFQDKDLDNEVDFDELTGISLGKGARIVLNGSTEGDIVANLNDLGTADPSDDELEMNTLPAGYHIAGIDVTGGNVDGSIIAGGNISNVTVAGHVGSILAGSAANGKAFDFYPDPELAGSGEGILSFVPTVGQAGSSISNLDINAIGKPESVAPLNGQIKAGDGGVGGKGGSITFVQIDQDSDGITILGGAGGDGGGSKRNGGAGGAVSRVYIGGFLDPGVETVLISGGEGGDSATAKAGAGGALKDVFVGYRLFGNRPFATDDLLVDRVIVNGGDGGAGKIGGAGGGITNADVRIKTVESIGDEISIVGGAGGASIAAKGKAGNGGNLLNIVARNQDLAGGAQYADTVVQGGAGGLGGLTSSGGSGGSVTNVTLLGWQLTVAGGSGDEGKLGGNGGSVTNLLVEENDDIVTIGAQVDAGAGGRGLAGNGGKGGNIKGVLLEDSDLERLIINGLGAANGGDSVGGKGGIGGSVEAIEIRESDVSNGATQTKNEPITVRTGTGGNGTKGGGAGGWLKVFSLDGFNVNAQLITGAGGNVEGTNAKGKGGAGGSFDNIAITVRGDIQVQEDLPAVPAFANLTAGAGGAGAGSNGAGGAGGDLRTVTVTADGEGFLQAGKGGSGQDTSGAVKGGAAGRGGNVQASQMRVLTGDGRIIAGDAGDGGAKGGIGGSITGLNSEVRSSLFAANDLIVQAGNGSHGGAGGSIRYFGYGSSVLGSNITPTGNVTIRAGNGSADGKAAGVGGSVFDVSGSLPTENPANPDAEFTVGIFAGNGGGNSTKGAAGGSVQEVILLGGGFDGAILTVQAGDAGDSPNASRGAKGGDVKNIIVSPDESGYGMVFRSVAAGDGGNARVGGIGGSIDGVYVEGIDIGSRRDVPYGFTQMGGLFAGVSGEGGASANGKVVNIVAKGIAAIVAGRDPEHPVPAPAEFVDNIILTGNNELTRDLDVFVRPGPFRLSYDAEVSATVQAEGTTGSQEVQELNLSVLQSGSAEIVLTYGANSTDPLPGNASAAQIQAELNDLASIKATGPGDTGSVTVVANGSGFVITFNTVGDQPGVITLDATSTTGLFPANAAAQDVEDALNLLPTIQYLGAELGQPVLGTVDVTGRNGSFIVTYQLNGDVVPLEGVEVFSANLTELTKGVVDRQISTELISGSIELQVDEMQSGEQPVSVILVEDGDVGLPERQGIDLDDFIGIPDVQMRFSFTGSFTATELSPGDNATREVQTINLDAINDDASATFTLSYNGGTTAPIARNATNVQIQQALNAVLQVSQAGGVSATFNGQLLQITFNRNGAQNEITGAVTSTTGLLPVTATDVQLQTAFNAMAAVRVTNPDLATGSVAVVANVDNSFFINFAENGNQPLFEGTAFMKEIQVIDHADLDASPTGTFDLSFSRTYPAVEMVKGGGGFRERQDIALGGVRGDANTFFTISYNNRTTTPLPGNASVTDIHNAIRDQLLLSVQTPVFSGNTLQITFTASVDQQFLFSVDAVSRTAALPANSSAADVQTALNALGTVKGPGAVPETVVVTALTDGDFEVIFQQNGERALIAAGLIGNEIQGVDVNEIADDATGSFRLGYGGDLTGELLASATPLEVQDALNALASIQAAGQVTVTGGLTAGTYDVRFTTAGEKVELDLQMEVDEIQNADITPGKPFVISVDHDVVADEVVKGDVGVVEVQSLRMGAILDSAAQYTLSFDPGTGVRQTTSVLAGTATAEQIQAALEALPSIGVGGVTVTRDAATIEVTFAVDNDQPSNIIAEATQSTPELPASATASDIQNAMNALATVVAKGPGGTQGTVVVNLSSGSSFDVRFNSGGDQEMVMVTQEQALIIGTLFSGSSARQEVQAFSPQAKGQPKDEAYANANLIGFYADHTEIDANTFHFIRDGILMDSNMDDFRPGDLPVDGLVFAKKWNTARIWGTPEAYRVGSVFYDWKNTI